MNTYCYSVGFFASPCLAWRSGLDEPPPAAPPPAPPIDTRGGSTEENPNYGRAPAGWSPTDQARIAAERTGAQLKDFFTSLPSENADGLIQAALVVGAVSALILALRKRPR